MQILHDWKDKFRVVAIDLIPEHVDEERILELFNGVQAGMWDHSSVLQLCLLNKMTVPSMTPKSAKSTDANSAANCDKESE